MFLRALKSHLHDVKRGPQPPHALSEFFLKLCQFGCFYFRLHMSIFCSSSSLFFRKRLVKALFIRRRSLLPTPSSFVYVEFLLYESATIVIPIDP
jgi:hypothetical protein